MMKDRVIAAVCVVLTMLFLSSAFGQPSADTATCAVTATVDTIMEWSGNFSTGIALGTMSAQGDTLTGSDTNVLYTNGNVDITAINTTAAELSESGGDTLYTEYQLSYDGNGTTATGGSAVSYAVYSSFLSSASVVTHYDEDGAVTVTLGARATNASGTLADQGSYTATATLTATWGTQ